MSTPKVTINVLGQQLSDEDRETLISGLHMVYMQAVKGIGEDRSRWQWILFPPPHTALLGKDKPDASKQNKLVYLERFQERAGNRSKWFHHYVEATQTELLLDVLRKRAAEGYTLGIPGHGTTAGVAAVVVPLEVSDYVKVWNNETPQKAIRHVEYALRPYKITVK